MSCTTHPLIIWLGQHIGEHDLCETLRSAFSAQSLSKCIGADGPALLEAELEKERCTCRTNPVEIVAFSTEAACTECLQKNKDKPIFLIISKPFGVEYVNACQKPLKDQNLSIYVLCTDIDKVRTQLGDDKPYVQIFSVETNLLARVTCAVGDYYAILALKQCRSKTLQSIRQAIEYYDWAEMLSDRVSDFEPLVVFDNCHIMLGERIAHAKELLKQYCTQFNEFDRCVRISIDAVVCAPEIEWEDPLPYNETMIVEIDIDPVREQSNSTILLDLEKEQQPEKNSEIRIVLLESSFQTKTFQSVDSNLSELIGKALVVVPGYQDYQQLMKLYHTPIVILSLSTTEGELMLDQLTSLRQPPPIYLLGPQPTAAKEREVFFSKHHSVCAMSNDPTELVIQVAVDIAMQNRISGDRYVREKNKYCAEQNYDQCIEILNRLHEFAEQNCQTNTDVYICTRTRNLSVALYMNLQRAVLLDSGDRHPLLGGHLGYRVERYTDRDACIGYIRNEMVTCQRIDLFLPRQDRNLIGDQLILFDNIYFHVYYPTVNDIPSDRASCMWIKLFEERELWVKISYAIYFHDWVSYRQSDFSPAARNRLEMTRHLLLQEVREAKLGVQAID